MFLHYWAANARHIAEGTVDATAWFTGVGLFCAMGCVMFAVFTLNDRYNFLGTKPVAAHKD